MQENISQLEKNIYSYIFKNKDFVLKNDERLEIAQAFGVVSYGLISWYPFRNNSDILQIGSGYGQITDYLLRENHNVSIVEHYDYKVNMLNARFDNLTIYNKLFSEFKTDKRYQYIICLLDETFDFLNNYRAYELFIKKAQSFLTTDGKFLFAVPNRLGLKYLCGYTDYKTDLPFDGITDNNSKLYRLDKSEILDLFSIFKCKKFYYPFPDYNSPLFIYTDKFQPDKDFSERISMYYTTDKNKNYLDEKQLASYLAKNNILNIFANSFFIEAGNTENSDLIYAVSTPTRAKEQSFTTAIYDSGIVKKIALYPEGEIGLENLICNINNLKKHKIPVLSAEKTDNYIKMRKVNSPSLLNYLKNSNSRQDILKLFDKLWGYILNSSEHTQNINEYFKNLSDNVDCGIILKNAYIEMIPANCFYENDDLLFFDQEYLIKDCPAKFVLYRAIEDLYNLYPQAESLVSKKELKNKYQLNQLWDYFNKFQAQFYYKLGAFDVYNSQSYWSGNILSVLENNRRKLTMNLDNKLDGSFDIITGLQGQRIILFGSGKYADYYLDKYEKIQKPIFIVDNNQEKWGTFKRNIQIKSPSELNKLVYGTFQVIITVANYEPIVEQLERMGIYEDSYRIYECKVDEYILGKIDNTITDGKYNIGYVTGVFDLFHIGHLNLLKKCKERSHYLIAGVLTDELAARDKEKVPFIPFEERFEIVKACRYVDRVYKIDFHNTNKVDAWNELKYGCLFAGSDHAKNDYWLYLRKQLRSLGSNMEIFPYTEGTSSTILQKRIKNAD